MKILTIENQICYWISAAEFKINRTIIANAAKQKRTAKFPIRLLSQDVDVDALVDIDDTLDCSTLFKIEFCVASFAVRSSRIFLISVVISGNNSQNIGSWILNSSESLASFRFSACVVSILPYVALVSHIKLKKPFNIEDIDLKQIETIKLNMNSKDKHTRMDSTNLDEMMLLLNIDLYSF